VFITSHRPVREKLKDLDLRELTSGLKELTISGRTALNSTEINVYVQEKVTTVFKCKNN